MKIFSYIRIAGFKFFFLSFFLLNAHQEQNLPFNKVIIWGHKLHSHTHSYIHYAFYRTFKHLGYDIYWLDNNDNVSNFDFTNSLFLTEGQVDQKMPQRNDCRYILHNCNDVNYKALYDNGNAIKLEVYTHACLKKNTKKIDNCCYIDLEKKCIYMPWATDLLPHEIDEIKKQVPGIQKENAVYFIGSYMSGVFDNTRQWRPFKDACKKNNIAFIERHASPEENITLIQKSFMAPAIQGKWQCEVGYIPCRIFKNISYGQFGITNSKTVYDLFKGKIIYNEDTNQLFYDALEHIQKSSLNELYELMDFVKEKHTYINRINYLIDFLDKVKNYNLNAKI